MVVEGKGRGREDEAHAVEGIKMIFHKKIGILVDGHEARLTHDTGEALMLEGCLSF